MNQTLKTLLVLMICSIFGTPNLQSSPISLHDQVEKVLTNPIQYELNMPDGGMLAYLLDPRDRQMPYLSKADGEKQYILSLIHGHSKVAFTNQQGEEVIKLAKDLSDVERSWFWKLDQSKARYFQLPPAEHRPTDAELKAFQNANEYGVWLDGKKIDNAELVNYSSQDIHRFINSRLMKNARHHGDYSFQVNLYTQKDFDNMYAGKEQGWWIPINLN